MPLLDVTIPFPPAPACADWCDGRHDAARDGWTDVGPGGVYKECRRTVHEATADGGEVLAVVVQRYAELVWPTASDEGGAAWVEPAGLTVETEAAVVRLDGLFNLAPDQAESLGRALIRAAEIAR